MTYMVLVGLERHLPTESSARTQTSITYAWIQGRRHMSAVVNMEPPSGSRALDPSSADSLPV